MTPIERAVEAARDVIAGWPIGSGYYGTTVGVGEAWEIARELADAGLLATDESEGDEQ